MVGSPFNEDSKNILFFGEALISGDGRPENLGKMGNNKDIVMQIGGWSISKENTASTPWYQNPCSASIFRGDKMGTPGVKCV